MEEVFWGLEGAPGACEIAPVGSHLPYLNIKPVSGCWSRSAATATPLPCGPQKRSPGSPFCSAQATKLPSPQPCPNSWLCPRLHPQGIWLFGQLMGICET